MINFTSGTEKQASYANSLLESIEFNRVSGEAVDIFVANVKPGFVIDEIKFVKCTAVQLVTAWVKQSSDNDDLINKLSGFEIDSEEFLDFADELYEKAHNVEFN